MECIKSALFALESVPFVYKKKAKQFLLTLTQVKISDGTQPSQLGRFMYNDHLWFSVLKEAESTGMVHECFNVIILLFSFTMETNNKLFLKLGSDL